MVWWILVFVELLHAWAILELVVDGFEVVVGMPQPHFEVVVDSVAQELPTSSGLMPNPAFAHRYWTSC